MRRRTPVLPTSVGRGIAVLVAASLATLVLLVTGTSAQAHDELVGSAPEADARLDVAPAEVELQFSGAIQELGTEVVVTASDGAAVSDGPVLVDGTSVVQPLAAELPAGGYSVVWRATSADGHPLSGEFSFTVAGGAGSGTATSSSAAPEPVTDVGEAAATTPAAEPSQGGWIAGAAAAVLLVAALVAIRRMRRRS